MSDDERMGWTLRDMRKFVPPNENPDKRQPVITGLILKGRSATSRDMEEVK